MGPSWIQWIVVVAVGYLLGAIPVGLIVGKVTKGVDIRQYGSGKVGATNTLRTLGWGPSAVVLLLDMAKAVLAVELARLLGAPPLIQALAGLGAVVGHCWSAFIGFNGGRGVAASLGSSLVISPVAGLVGLAVFGLATWRTRYVSLGSLSGAIVGSIIIIAQAALGALEPGYAALGVAAVIIVVRHLDNIARLRAGTERKLGEKATKVGGTQAVRRPEAP
jgi:acyl phosphate:glycerol-3-phosphate acyltransferase